MNELTPAEAEAAELIETTYSKYGEGDLSCSCGREGVPLTESFIGDVDHIRWVRNLIEHSRTGHSVPYVIVFAPRPVIVMNPTRTTDRKEHDNG